MHLQEPRMNLRYLALAALAVPLFLAAGPASAGALHEAKPADRYATHLQAFEDHVRAWMKKEGVPAFTIGFVKDDYMWVKGFGFADVENQVPASAESAYRYASVQKSMTAAAVLQLVERGRISLDAEIQTYVPYYPRKSWPVTVRQLLGHLGGVPHYVNREVEQHFTTHKSTREAIAVFEHYDLVAEPGTKFSYSTYGYDLLGAAIESASGLSYGDYMRDRVWGPAGMTATAMDDPLALVPHRVRGYQELDGQLRNSEFVDVSSRFGGGGTRGTVPDLLRFLTALNQGRLLSAASLSLMATPMKTRDGGLSGFPKTEGYAMGWNVAHSGGHLILLNDGGQQETRTLILDVPDRRFAIALAQNLEKDTSAEPLFELYQLVLGEKLEL
jgi:CubicO group peptidase (beta-lactamase class C family)